MPVAVVAFGSNIEPAGNLARARERLARRFGRVAESRFVRTAPIGRPDQAEYLNGAFRFETSLGLEELREALREIESQLGRARGPDKYAPRTVDLDVAAYDGRVVDEEVYLRDFLHDAVVEVAPELGIPLGAGRVEVTLVQQDTAWEDPEANFARVRMLLDRSPPPPGGLIVLCELFACGFSMNTDRVAEPPHGLTADFLADIASRWGCCVLGGRAVREGGAVRNEAWAVDPEGILLARYAKRHPFTFAGEHERYAAGADVALFEWSGVTFAPMICYDLRFPETFRRATVAGAECFLAPANWPRERADDWSLLLRARALENLAFVVGVNRTGTDPNVAYAGGSCVVGPDGAPLCVLGDRCETQTVTMPVGWARHRRESFGALTDIQRSELGL